MLWSFMTHVLGNLLLYVRLGFNKAMLNNQGNTFPVHFLL